MVYNREALPIRQIFWRCTEVAVTGLTRNQFVGLCRHKGSNPFISAGVFIREMMKNLVNTPFFYIFSVNFITIDYHSKLVVLQFFVTEFVTKNREDDTISAGKSNLLPALLLRFYFIFLIFLLVNVSLL